jgi:restriction system protein
MANVTRRRTGELLRKLFEILLQQPDGMAAKDALAALAQAVTLTDYEAGNYESGGRRFEKIVRFSTVDTTKAGWLLKSKGRWTVTEPGREAWQQRKDPEAFYKEAVKLYWRWRDSQVDDSKELIEPAVAAREEAQERGIGRTFEESEERAWEEISSYLQGMPPYDFQELVAELLKAMGYHVAWVSPPGKDAGIDIVAWVDPLGTRPPRIKVQVKRRTDKVGADGLRSFLAVIGAEDVGIYVAAGGFTKDAEDEARRYTDRRITLINLERLFDLWIEFYPKLSDDARRRLPLKPIYFLAPED